MTAPRLAACYFGEGEHGEVYRRLAKVLEFTAHRHLAGWDIHVDHLSPADVARIMAGRDSALKNPSHVWNTTKLRHWVDYVEAAADGDQLVLIDGDMMILKPLDPVWEKSFDVAYTFRETTRLPLNGGLIALRVGPRSRAWFQRLWEVNVEFLKDATKHRPWRFKYAGINQAAMGYLIECEPALARVEKIPCGEWNCCEWERTYRPQRTRVVHVKSTLRRTLFKVRPVPRASGRARELIQLWAALEKEANEWQRRRTARNVSSDTGLTRSTFPVG